MCSPGKFSIEGYTQMFQIFSSWDQSSFVIESWYEGLVSERERFNTGLNEVYFLAV